MPLPACRPADGPGVPSETNHASRLAHPFAQRTSGSGAVAPLRHRSAVQRRIS